MFRSALPPDCTACGGGGRRGGGVVVEEHFCVLLCTAALYLAVPVLHTHLDAIAGGGWGDGASRTQKHSEAGYGRPVDRGVWAAKTVKRPPQQPAHPQYAHYWAPLTRKQHIPPHPAQPRHINDGAPRTRKGHQQEHRPQRPTERSDPTQHAKGRTGDCPGPRKETTTRRNVTQGGGGGWGGCTLGHGGGLPDPPTSGTPPQLPCAAWSPLSTDR